MEQVTKGISLKADGPVNGCNMQRENKDDICAQDTRSSTVLATSWALGP